MTLRRVWYRITEIKYVPRYIWWALQRIFRGYSDRDIWRLDLTIAEFVLPRLQHFRKVFGGEEAHMPSNFCFDKDGNEKDWDRAQRRWNKILDSMILAFELTIKDQEGLLSDTEHKQIYAGLQAFGKYLLALWD